MDDVGFVDYYDEGVKVGGKRDKGGEKREGTQMRLRHKLNKVKKIEKNNKYILKDREFFFSHAGKVGIFLHILSYPESFTHSIFNYYFTSNKLEVTRNQLLFDCLFFFTRPNFLVTANIPPDKPADTQTKKTEKREVNK